MPTSMRTLMNSLTVTATSSPWWWPRKYSKHIYNKTQSAYKRIWDPALGTEGGDSLSVQIKDDTERVINGAYPSIYNHRGYVLDTSTYKGWHAQLHKETVMGRRKRAKYGYHIFDSIGIIWYCGSIRFDKLWSTSKYVIWKHLVLPGTSLVMIDKWSFPI